jgi:plastocyanin
MSLRLRTLLVLSAAVILAAAVACGKASPNAPSAMPVGVTIANGSFSPNSTSIGVGTAVTWTNKDTAAHSVVADSGAFSSGSIAPNGQYSYTFPTAGTFNYHDGTNAGMTGVVIVSGSSSTSPY